MRGGRTERSELYDAEHLESLVTSLELHTER